VAGFRSREEAEAALVEALAAYGGGDRRTVAGYLELMWLPAKAGAIDRSTFDQYAWAVRRHVLPALGPVRLADLEPKSGEGLAGTQDGAFRTGRLDGGRGAAVPGR
jgi:hypothetical protein